MEYHYETTQDSLKAIGASIRQLRLNANLSQAHLAESMGVALKTIQNLENGRNPTLATFLSALQNLGFSQRLEQLFPTPGPSPIQTAKRSGKQRKRARQPLLVKDPPTGEWKW